MQKSYRQRQNGTRKYQKNSKQTYKLKQVVSNDGNSPIVDGLFRPQKTLKRHKNINSSLDSIGMNTLLSPTHSVFEKKIREAIEVRYQKSKINDYQYVKIQDQNNQKDKYSRHQSSQSKQSSQSSQKMQEMRHVAYLKNISFVNINNYHSQKYLIEKQTSVQKERNRKRRFKVPLSFGNLNSNQKPIQSNLIENERKNQIPINEQSNSNNILNLLLKKKLQQSQTLNCIRDQQIIEKQSQQKQKKFLTSRLPYQRQQINLQSEEIKNLSILSPTFQISSHNKIKDTFQLKYPNKFLNKNDTNNQQQQTIRKEQQKTQRSSQKTTTKARRFLLPKNQKLQNIKTQPNQVSQLSYRVQNSNHDSSYQKITSIRKIQTQFIEPLTNQHQIHNRTTKNKAKMIKNYRNNNFLINRINQNSQKSFHSASQQKWKLQEISFKFKPVNELQNNSKNNLMQKIQQNKNQALKIGLSLQKAYSKILENKKKMQKKEESSARKINVSQQKKKRRMLRISPKNDQSLIINGQRESKLIKKDQSINFCSAILIENRSQESLSGQRVQSTRYKFLKNNKGERFSTIQ